MYTGQVAVISNRATWTSDIVELVDEDDGTITDLSDPEIGTVDIVVTIFDLRGDCCAHNNRATASIANEKVSVPGPGFEWQFEVSDLSGLCAGTYGLGVKVTINGFVADEVIGTLAVVEGN